MIHSRTHFHLVSTGRPVFFPSLEHGTGGKEVYSLDFSFLDLRNAKFNHADLRNADFTGALLNGASLQNAILTGAIFKGAQLDGADLTRADLRRATLRDCTLNGTNFDEALFGNSFLSRLDFSECVNLQFTRHTVPSELDFESIIRSDFPGEHFLEGLGFSKEKIHAIFQAFLADDLLSLAPWFLQMRHAA